jgi:hypothetical protein
VNTARGLNTVFLETSVPAELRTDAVYELTPSVAPVVSYQPALVGGAHAAITPPSPLVTFSARVAPGTDAGTYVMEIDAGDTADADP